MPSRGMIIITGIICLTIIECTAMLNGVNGWYFTLVTMVIAAAIGVEVKTLFDIVRSREDGEKGND